MVVENTSQDALAVIPIYAVKRVSHDEALVTAPCGCVWTCRRDETASFLTLCQTWHCSFSWDYGVLALELEEKRATQVPYVQESNGVSL